MVLDFVRSFTFEEAMKLLKDKGLNTGDRIRIKEAFFNKAYQDDPNIEKVDSNFKSTKRDSLIFSTKEDVKLYNALIDLAPETSDTDLMSAQLIVYKLLNIPIK